MEIPINCREISFRPNSDKLFIWNSVINSYFMFNNMFYKQRDGLVMGVPLGPTFSNTFMCFHEKNWLNNCPDSFKPILYRRYVEDTFVLFRSEKNAQVFMNY